MIRVNRLTSSASRNAKELTKPYANELDLLLGESQATALERERDTFDLMTAPFRRRLVIFGAGKLGRDTLRTLNRHGWEVLAFSDSQSAKWGNEVDGTKVLPPRDAAREFGRTATFVVAISARGGDFLPLQQRLLDLGCAGVVPYRSLFWKYPDDCPPHLVADRPCRILQEKKEIRAVLGLLGDDASCREYVGQLRWRLLQDFGALPASSGEEQYFPPDIITFRRREVFVDCGAYDGDTVRPFLRRCPGFARILALEPDPANFAQLTGFIGGLPADVRERLSARMVCVGDKRGKVRFAVGGGKHQRSLCEGKRKLNVKRWMKSAPVMAQPMSKWTSKGQNSTRFEGRDVSSGKVKPCGQCASITSRSICGRYRCSSTNTRRGIVFSCANMLEKSGRQSVTPYPKAD